MQKVASFSGGEKARLALALIVWQRPNLLLLDEPTNHLDIDMREALAQALTDFEGALIVVAHDRALLTAATDQWMLVADGAVGEFEGDLDDYKEWARQYHRAREGRRDARDDAQNRKQERRAEAAKRQREADVRKPFEKKLAAIESELLPLEAEARQIEAWLASGEAYEEAQREQLQTMSRRRGEVAARVAQLEEDWLWVQAELEREVNRVRA
jgi:ATP-binding cassette subfamily F protein 3